MNDIPPLPSRDLPPGRHRLLREHLMDEIREHTPAPAAPPRRRRLRPAVAGPALAGVLTLAVVGGVAVAGADGSGDRPAAQQTQQKRQTQQPRQSGGHAEATYAFAPNAGEDTRGGAPELLGRIAAVAEARTADSAVRDDQFVYIRSKVAWSNVSVRADGRTSEPELHPLHQREVWLSVDGSREGLLREPGGAVGEGDVSLDAPPAPGTPGHAGSTSYRHLSTLPTDPGAMLAWLRDNRGHEDGHDRDADQDAWVLGGELVHESLMPPDVSAALYRALAEIPGVVVVPDAVDAAGRHGIAVARVDAYNPGVRDELIFDKETLELLGSRSVAIKDGQSGRAGQVLGTSAVLERAVVDRAGQVP
ncbi:hypothetical protein GCM10027168_04160 [Streptomyces capparidis]